MQAHAELAPYKQGFESKREYDMYMQLRESLKQKVPVGIAS